MKQNNSALYSALSFLLIALLMLSVVGVIMRYTNGGTTDFALFYVAHDGQNIMTDTTVSLNDGETATFAPRYSADDIMSAVGQETKTKGYNVKIVPNITKETSFTYRVGDNKYRFEKLADTDFSSAFNLKKEEKSFSVKVDEFTVQNLLSAQYENKMVTMPDDFYGDQIYFNLIISSYDEKNNLVIGLKSPEITFSFDGKKYSAPREATLNGWAKSKDCDLTIIEDCVVVDGLKYPINGGISGKNLIKNNYVYRSYTYEYYIRFSSFPTSFLAYSNSVRLYQSWREIATLGIFSDFYISNGLVYGKQFSAYYCSDEHPLGGYLIFVVQYNGVDISPDDYVYTEKMEDSFYSIREVGREWADF